MKTIISNSIILLILLCAATGFAAYYKSLSNGFCYDENIVILRNKYVQEDGKILEIFKGTYWGTGVSEGNNSDTSKGYRPITILTYYFTRKFSDNDPFWFHFFNVVLHTSCCILLVLLMALLRIDFWIITFSALFFTVHAIHTEAVAQIVGRAELLSALFVLLGLVIHTFTFTFLRTDSSVRKIFKSKSFSFFMTVIASLICFTGILAKEDAASFILAAFCVDIFVTGESRTVINAIVFVLKSRWKVYLAYFVPIIVFIGLRAILIGKPLPTFDVHFVDNPLAGINPFLRPLGAVAVWGKVILLLLLPLRLSADYGFDQIPVARFYMMPEFYAGIFILFAGTILSIYLRRKLPHLFLGWMLFCVTYFPVSNIPFLIHTILGERILYIPSIGFCIFVASLPGFVGSLEFRYFDQNKMKAISLVIFIALILFNTIRTFTRCGDWKDDISLFESAAKVSNRSVRVLNNYGNVLFLKGDISGAEESYRKALSIFPQYDDAAMNLSILLVRKGNVPEAIKLLEGIAIRNPKNKRAIQFLKNLHGLSVGKQ